MKNEEKRLLDIKKLIESKTTFKVYSVFDTFSNQEDYVYSLYIYLPYSFDDKEDIRKALYTPLFITLDGESTVSLCIFVGKDINKRRKQIYLIPDNRFTEIISDKFIREIIINEFTLGHSALKNFTTKYSGVGLIPEDIGAQLITEVGTDLVTRRYIVYEDSTDLTITIPEEVVNGDSDVIYSTKEIELSNIRGDTIEEYMNSDNTTIKVVGDKLLIKHIVKWNREG